ncbi:MAG: cupin domain-containing protein [Desulfurobacteriaceae bacterium]
MVVRTGIIDKDEVLKILKKEEYTNLFVWYDPPNTTYDWHTHPFDEVRWIIDGEITIGTEREVVTLYPGDKMNVPAGTRHFAKVGNEGVVYICGCELPLIEMRGFPLQRVR